MVLPLQRLRPDPQLGTKTPQAARCGKKRNKEGEKTNRLTKPETNGKSKSKQTKTKETHTHTKTKKTKNKRTTRQIKEPKSKIKQLKTKLTKI